MELCVRLSRNVSERFHPFATHNTKLLTSVAPQLARALGMKKTKVVEMSQDGKENKFKLYKVVLTGGPSGGKTTGQTRLSTFFENLGWKVYRAPEAAFTYFSGGVVHHEMSREQSMQLQEDIIRTMMMIEDTFCRLSEGRDRNVLLICDRGSMDGSVYLQEGDWKVLKEKNKWNEVDLRDNRYNQVIHMVSAARGAEPFYTLAGHATRREGIDLARNVDLITARAWVGHPYYDVIDNSTNFDEKIARMIDAVCNRIGIDTGDRLAPNSIKRKFLVSSIEDDSVFPHFQEFSVVHDYLVTPSRKMQARLRKRGQEGYWTYTHTIRRPEINDQSVELRMPISEKDYEILLAQRDDQHYTVYKIRRCFLWNDQYFQLDIYQDPTPPKCKNLMLLETYTTEKAVGPDLPSFLKVDREVTNESQYSMFNLSQKDSFASAESSSNEEPNGTDP